MNAPEQSWWLTPAATLIAAVLGGMIPMITALIIFEIQGERDRLRELAEKAEKLYRKVIDAQNLYTSMLRYYDVEGDKASRDDEFAPCMEAITNQAADSISMVTYSTDHEVVILLEGFQRHIQVLCEGMRELRDFEIGDSYATIDHDPKYDELTHITEKIRASQEKVRKSALHMCIRISELREKANRTLYQRLRQVVHNA